MPSLTQRRTGVPSLLGTIPGCFRSGAARRVVGETAQCTGACHPPFRLRTGRAAPMPKAGPPCRCPGLAAACRQLRAVRIDSVEGSDAVQVLQLRRVRVGKEFVSGSLGRLERRRGFADSYANLCQKLAHHHTPLSPWLAVADHTHDSPRTKHHGSTEFRDGTERFLSRGARRCA
ncbi:hypothetical protein Tfu_1942 [Thermobifida fusca YX]|uniref:Uncharacterized protein n=1 Tax=Thermobifida fusca (strain YX) TaxID=269800 RepID=Q47NJ4_THEFY|nr:hypothetical protein Tfu_1942 [Thermobifida fusca YX]